MSFSFLLPLEMGKGSLFLEATYKATRRLVIFCQIDTFSQPSHKADLVRVLHVLKTKKIIGRNWEKYSPCGPSGHRYLVRAAKMTHDQVSHVWEVAEIGREACQK